MISSILQAQYDFPSPDWDQVSNDAKSFIKSLICVNPLKRATCEQALNHLWLNDKHENKNLIDKVGTKLQLHLQAKRKLKVKLGLI